MKYWQRDLLKHRKLNHLNLQLVVSRNSRTFSNSRCCAIGSIPIAIRSSSEIRGRLAVEPPDFSPYSIPFRFHM